TVDPARAAVKRADFAGALFGPLRAPADGAARLQSAVSLVRRPLAGRFDLEPDRVHQEPGTPSRRRCVPEVHDQASQTEKVKPLLSDEHFSGDGTLIEAWASHKSFKPKQAKTDDDGSNFHGQLGKNDTHQSTTDPEAKLYRKADGREAKLSYLGHALMENKNGLAVGGMVTQAD